MKEETLETPLEYLEMRHVSEKMWVVEGKSTQGDMVNYRIKGKG